MWKHSDRAKRVPRVKKTFRQNYVESSQSIFNPRSRLYALIFEIEREKLCCIFASRNVIHGWLIIALKSRFLWRKRGETTKRTNASGVERGNSGFSQSLWGCRFSDTKAIMDFFNKRPRLNSFDQFSQANSHPPRPPPTTFQPSLPFCPLSRSPPPPGSVPNALWRLALRDLRGSKNLPLIKRPAPAERRLPFSPLLRPSFCAPRLTDLLKSPWRPRSTESPLRF